jgi:hypothetical protein
MAHPLALSRFLRQALPACLLAWAACVPEVELPDDAEACAGLRCNGGQCVSNAGQPMCRCGPWEAAAELNCKLGGAEEPDDHGASPGDATELTLPMPVRMGLIGSMGNGGVPDLDLFAFTAEEQHIYRFTCGGQVSTLPNCRVRVRNASGVSLTPLNQELREGVRTTVVTLPAGRWYLEVSNETRSGTYLYQLEDLGRDDHGDVPGTATPLPALGRDFAMTHTTHYDWDVFSFRTVAGRYYRFSCKPEAPGRWGAGEWDMKLTTPGGGELKSYKGPGVGSAGEGLMVYEAKQTLDVLAYVRVEKTPFPSLAVCRIEESGVPIP